MEVVIIVVHLMIVIAMIAVILLQRSEGGALGIGGGGGGGMFTARGSANLLTRTTTILAIAFFTTSLGLGLLAKSQQGAPSILGDGTTAPAGSIPLGDAATRGTGEGLLETLREQSGAAPPSDDPVAAPTGAPSAPAATPSPPTDAGAPSTPAAAPNATGQSNGAPAAPQVPTSE